MRKPYMRSVRRQLVLALIVTMFTAGLPALPRTSPISLPLPEPAAAETVAKPKYVSAALMPNGQVGLLYANGDNGVNTSAEIRFFAYKTEHSAFPSVQLSTAGPMHPQLATFGDRLVAAYVDTRAANQFQLVFRASDDSGATWGAEFYPFGSETFDMGNRAPRVIASADGATLYLFTAAHQAIPWYRSTVDPTLASWTAAAPAGDASMRITTTNECGDASECQRAHAFSLMETATAGSWIYIAKSDSGWGQSGRGTQVGTIGGSWSAQVDHFGSGDLSGQWAHSGATTFVGRSGYVYFIRATTWGEQIYMKRSTDGGYSWDDAVYAFDVAQPTFTGATPVGLYNPIYSLGEYVWYAGFGGTEHTVRVTPLWNTPHSYSDSGTVRLFGSAGGDLDVWSEFPETFGQSLFGERVSGGGYSTSASDLSLPGRRLGMSFQRWYNSGDPLGGPLGPGWQHSFNWKVLESATGDFAEIRTGDGAVLRYTKNPDSSYAKPHGRFENLVKNGDGSFSFTTPSQTKFDLRGPKATVQGDVARDRTHFVWCSAYSDPWTPTTCANAVDGSDTTFFLANGTWEGGEGTWGVDLSEPTAITSFRLVAGCNGTFRRYYIESSPDSTAWTVRYDSLVDVTAGDLGTITLAGGPFSARYWRVRGNGTAPCGMRIFTVNLTGAMPDPIAGKLTRISEPAGNQILLGYTGAQVTTITDTVGRATRLSYSSGANTAVGRPYTKSHEPTSALPDTNNVELTDGDRGTTEAIDHFSWQEHTGMTGLPLLLTVDLGTSTSLGAVRGYWAGDGTWTWRPDSMDVLTSDNNIDFTLRGSTSAATKEGSYRYRMDIANVNTSARYVQFRANSSTSTIFVSELEIFERYFEPVTLGYNVGERLMHVIDPAGRRTSYGYDAAGRLATVVDMLGNTAGQDPNAHKWVYGYDGASRHIATVTDPDARVRVTNTFDDLGQLLTQRDGLLNTTSYAYSPGQVIVTDPRTHPTTLSFDPLGRIISREDTVGSNTYIEAYGYDGYGSREFVIDRIGSRTDFTNDDRGNLLAKIDPQVDIAIPRYVTTFQYDLKNNITQVTDARSFVTTNTFDPVTNVQLSSTQQITSGPATYAVTKWEYGDVGNPGLPTKIISPRGNTTGTPNYTYSQTLTYDAQANLTERLDADGNKTTFGYDSLGRQTTMVDPDGYAAGGVPAQHTWTTVFDANDRVTQATDPLAHSTLTSYDGAGNSATATDRNGNVTTYTYDNAARLLSVKQKPDPVGQPALIYTTSVARDANGNATQVTQGNSVVTDYAYDVLNRLTSFTSHPGSPGPANLTTSYVLDGNGNPTSRTTADTVVTSYVYDAMSRLKTVSAAGLSTITYAYDELSRRTSMGDGTGTSTYAYDGLSRLTQAVQPNGTLGYGYDLDSNRTTLTYPTVGSVTYVFSPASRLSSLTDWGARTSSYTYSAAGLAKTLTVPGGMTTTYSYDNAQRLTSLVNSTAGGTISSDIYTLDNEGNRTAIDEIMGGGALASVKVNSDTGTVVQDHPSIAVGADGASYLIWDDLRNGNANIYFDRSDPVTGLWGTTDVKVNTDSGTRIQLNPDISMDSSSNAYAVWQDERNGAGKADIYYSKRDAGSGTWLTPNLKVSDDPGASGGAVQRNPAIAGTAAGIETAVWVDLRSSQNNIYSSQLNLPSCIPPTNWCPNKRVTDNTSALKDFPDVAVDEANTAYAVWQDSRNGNADIFFSTLASGAGAWAANLKISDDPGTAAQTKPRIGIDSAGNLTAAWIDARTTPAKVRVARKPAGGAWSASIEISPAPANVQSLALSVRPDGYAWAIWGDTRGTSQDIWGSRYDPYLAAWSAPQRLDDDPGTTAAQLNPAVAFSTSETMLAWRDNRLNANGNTQARRVVFAPGLTDHFALAYDGLNRLKSVSGPVSETFALDGGSNVTNRSGTVETYDNANRLTQDGSTAQTWSNADRLTQRGSDTFGYDALDRMTSSNVSGTLRSYTYNGDGLLKSRTQGSTTNFLWDPDTEPSRLVKQGGDHLIYGLGPLYVVKADATTLTLARDGSKNVRAELSGAGAVTAAFRYRAYGQLAQSTTASPTYLGLASQLIDPSGLYYMRARWYEPVTGRFISRDPLLGTTENPSTLNAFGYASGRPGNRFDPSGMRDSTATEGEGSRCDFVCLAKGMLDGIGQTTADLLSLMPAPPSLPDAVLDIVAGDDPASRAAAEHAWQTVAGLGAGGLGNVRVVRSLNNLPKGAKLFHGKDGLREVTQRLETYHGIDPAIARARLHQIKQSQGVANDADLVFDATGNVYHPTSGQLLGSLTGGGSR